MSNPIDRLKSLVADDLAKVDRYIIDFAKSKVTDLVPDIILYISNAGGKRLRPLFTLVCSRMLDCDTENPILLATAVEFIHTATLLHDDVVDQSVLRRNMKTANNIWGDKASILVGDYLFSQAFKLMVQTNSLSALDTLSHASAIIAESEVWQLQLIGKLDIAQEDYLKLITTKTAVLFAAACEVGGIAAGATSEMNASLYAFGLNFGIAFQIMDDFLDYFGDSFQFGKQIGNDFMEGKVTLPIIMLYNLANPSEKVTLDNAFIAREKSNGDFMEIKSLLQKYNVRDAIMEVISSYSSTALRAMDGCGDSEYSILLKELTIYATSRCY